MAWIILFDQVGRWFQCRRCLKPCITEAILDVLLSQCCGVPVRWMGITDTGPEVVASQVVVYSMRHPLWS